MGAFEELNKIWKELGIKGQVKNFSSKPLWVLETESGRPIARVLSPGFKTPVDVDVDGFKRVDGGAIEGHKNWWKFYDFSTAEVFDEGSSLRVSAISKRAVPENHFGDPVLYKEVKWGTPIQVISDVRRDKKKRIVSYYVSGKGWVGFEQALKLTCHHQIDNARPVFPSDGRPYIRTRRDPSIFNNLSNRGRA